MQEDEYKTKDWDEAAWLLVRNPSMRLPYRDDPPGNPNVVGVDVEDGNCQFHFPGRAFQLERLREYPQDPIGRFVSHRKAVSALARSLIPKNK